MLKLLKSCLPIIAAGLHHIWYDALQRRKKILEGFLHRFDLNKPFEPFKKKIHHVAQAFKARLCRGSQAKQGKPAEIRFKKDTY